MKTIIAGSRDGVTSKHVCEAVLYAGWDITEVVSGEARGADKFGEQWAEAVKIPIKRFPADWDKYGKSAGYRRNEEMAGYAQALIAVWNGTSKGTANMIELATKAGLMVYVHEIKEDELITDILEEDKRKRKM